MSTRVEPSHDVIGTAVTSLDTPALLVDLDLMQRNIERIAERCRASGVGWRPHAKGLKVPAVAQRCLEAGAIGVTCAKVGDAEWLVRGRIDNILIANEIIGDSKLDRVARLRTMANVIICIDSLTGLEMAAAAARRNGVDLAVCVEVDTGMKRCGTAPGEPTLALARAAHETSGIRFEGLMAWEGHALSIADAAERETEVRRAVGELVATAELCQANGLPVRIVSAGGTGTYVLTTTLPGITEVQAGGGVFGDRTYARWGAPVDFSLTILTTVISRPTPTRIVVDAGKKAVSADLTPPWPKTVPNVASQWFAAEHTVIELSEPADTPRVGDKIELIAGYGDTTVFLHDELYAHRDGRVEEVWPVAPRVAHR